MLRKVLRNRSFRFAAAFAVAVVVPVAVLVYVQLGAVRDLERTSVLVLEALSRQTADAIAKAIEQDFEQPVFVIERLDHLAIERFRLLTVSDGLIRATRLSRLADAYYLWSENAAGGHAAPVLELPGRGLPGVPSGDGRTTPVHVTLDAGATAGNGGVADLAADLNAVLRPALAAEGFGEGAVTFGADGKYLTLAAGDATILRVAIRDAAALGFAQGQAVSRPGAIIANRQIHGDVDLVASLAFLELGIKDGFVDLGLTTGLMLTDPPGGVGQAGRITLGDFRNARLSDLVGVVPFTLTGEAALPLDAKQTVDRQASC